MDWLRNVWYVAALPGELGRHLLARTFLDQPVLLYRRQDGVAVAVSEICPHRFAPLRVGTLRGDDVECKYHGLRFSDAGSCIWNPHGDVIPPNLRLTAYPLVERYNFCWIWMGNPDLADPDLIPNMHFDSDVINRRMTYRYLPANYRHDILVDNLMDASHADYLHLGSFSNGPAASNENFVRQEGNTVVVERFQYSQPGRPAHYAEVGKCV